MKFPRIKLPMTLNLLIFTWKFNEKCGSKTQIKHLFNVHNTIKLQSWRDSGLPTGRLQKDRSLHQVQYAHMPQFIMDIVHPVLYNVSYKYSVLNLLSLNNISQNRSSGRIRENFIVKKCLIGTQQTLGRTNNICKCSLHVLFSHIDPRSEQGSYLDRVAESQLEPDKRLVNIRKSLKQWKIRGRIRYCHLGLAIFGRA